MNLSLYNIYKGHKITQRCRVENLRPHHTFKGPTVSKWMHIYLLEVYQGHLYYINTNYSNLLQRIRRITIYGTAQYHKKALASQNTAVNVRSVTVLRSANYGRNRIRYGEKPYGHHGILPDMIRATEWHDKGHNSR